MTQVTAEMVKKLRERTGVGMAQCKQALDNAHGDMEKAIDILRKAGMASAVKKEARETNEGLIGNLEDSSHIVFVEVNAETDFVVQNERFKDFLHLLCHEAMKLKPTSLEQLLEHKITSRQNMSVEQIRVELVHSLGENIKVNRVFVLPKAADCSYGVYAHLGGKIVTAVEIKGSNHDQTLARDVAMHVAAESPEYLKSEDVPSHVLDRERDIAADQIKNKPPEFIEKIIQGKLKAFYDQVCLVCQKFVKDNSLTVEQYVESVGKKHGHHLVVSHFLRWQVGDKA